MEIGLLGTLEVRDDDGTPITVTGARQRALLAVLALRPGLPTRADRLIDDLWGDRPPQQPGNALQVAVSKLRRAVGAARIVTSPSGYALAITAADVDSHRFERLTREGRQALTEGKPDIAAEHLSTALGLWRDVPLIDFADMPTAVTASSRWQELRDAAAEDRFDALLTLGLDSELIAELDEAVTEAPYRERLRGQHMLALYRAGRQADALRAYSEARRALADELGIEPSAELRYLELAILNHDPALDVRRTIVGATSRAEAPEDRNASTATAVGLRSGLGQLFGRDDERQRLRRGLETLLTAPRTRPVTLISGEPGIGKTRLAEELVGEAAERGVAVAWARCYAGRGAPAFWPWIQIVRSVLARFPEEQVRAAIGSGAGDLAQIVPEVKEMVPDLVPPAPTDPESARFRLYESFTALTRRLARETPLIVVIDDLHWADQASLELFAFLAAQPDDARIWLLATYRTIDPTVSGSFSETLADLSRQRGVTRVDLVGLDSAAVADLVASHGIESSDGAVATLMQRTQGNPFFLGEIMRLIPQNDGPEDPTVTEIVPDSVRDVIRRRLAALPEPTNAVLSAAAVLDQDVDPVLLASMTGTSAATVLDDLEPAVHAGLLVPIAGVVGRYSFSHGLVRETIYRDLRTTTRPRLHHRAALALQAHHGNTAGPHLVPAADHWLHAVPVVPTDDAVDAMLGASDWAVGHLAHRQAEELLRAALELVATMPDDSRRAVRELQVLDQLSGLLVVSAGYSAERLEQVCDRMLELSRRTADRYLMLGALWRLSLYFCTVSKLDKAVELGEMLLQLGDDEDQPEQVLLVGHMAMSTPLILRGELSRAREHLDIAYAMCESGHGEALEGIVLETPGVWVRSFAGWNWWLLGDADAASRLLKDGVSVGAEQGATSYALAVSLVLAAWVASMAQNADATREHSRRGIACAIAGGYEVQLFFLIVDGWADAALGDVDGGAEKTRSASEQMQAAGTTIFRPYHFALRADMSLMAGRFADAIDLAEQGLGVVAETGERWCEAELRRLRAVALAAIDPSDPAVTDELARAVDVGRDQGGLGFLRRAESSRAALST